MATGKKQLNLPGRAKKPQSPNYGMKTPPKGGPSSNSKPKKVTTGKKGGEMC